MYRQSSSVFCPCYSDFAVFYQDLKSSTKSDVVVLIIKAMVLAKYILTFYVFAMAHKQKNRHENCIRKTVTKIIMKIVTKIVPIVF